MNSSKKSQSIGKIEYISGFFNINSASIDNSPSPAVPDIKGTNLHFPLFPPAKDGIAAFHIGIHFPLPASSNKNISGVKAAAFCDPLFVVPPSRLTTVNSPNL